MIAGDKYLRKICVNYEQVENYEYAATDETQKWDLHHRREIDEMKSKQQLIDEGKYFNVEPEELIFLTHGEHRRLHGTNALAETRNKMSESHKGEKSNFYGKTHTEETKKKMSESKKGENHPMYGKHHSDETRRRMVESHKGKHWYNNGVVNVRARECPEGFVLGRLRTKINNKRI